MDNDDAPYYDEDTEVIVFPGIRFPHHYKVQDWLNGTDRNADFSIVVNDKSKHHAGMRAGLKPTTRRVMFYWKLHGFEKLEQEILDFKPER